MSHSFKFGNEKILGAVGMLQFEVVKYRLEDEYNVRGEYQPYNFTAIRWIKFEDESNSDSFIIKIPISRRSNSFTRSIL